MIKDINFQLQTNLRKMKTVAAGNFQVVLLFE